ncbi:MAG TPA: NMD3-related protein [Candidatus Thermoplasmatota archaeon]|nr:NMD3-related protein [Candidatus Thermoplasmatota archaeon]
MMQTCVECGAQVPKLIGGCCPDCFVKKEALLMVPEVLDVELCAHCDARHVGAHWFDPDEGVPLSHIREEALRGAVRVHPLVRGADVEIVERVQDERNFQHTVRLAGDVEGVPVQSEAKALVRMRKSVCDRCSRMFGGYYAAIIQLRGNQRDARPEEIKRAHKVIGDEMDRLRAAGNRQAFLTKSGPVPGGFDYYIGDIEAARIISKLIASRLFATVQETAKLAGRKEGEDIYRVTFLVRIALYSTGDFARRGAEGLVQVLQIDKGKVLVYDMGTHRRDKVPEEELRRLGGPELLKEAVLVSQDSGNLQVLDPVSLHTVDLPRPEGYVADGATIWVLRHEERLFVPPVLPAHLK